MPYLKKKLLPFTAYFKRMLARIYLQGASLLQLKLGYRLRLRCFRFWHMDTAAGVRGV